LPIMWENIQVNRMLVSQLPDTSNRTLLILTGARQTGKTTLVRAHYNGLAYYNLDAIEFREQLSSISSFRWSNDVGEAVIDEIQKEPALFDKIKYAFDEKGISFSVLTGSSQILLLKKVQETLAGRVILQELFPFMLRELMHPKGENPIPNVLSRLISEKELSSAIESLPSVLLGKDWDLAKNAENWLFTWGGMAPLIHIPDPKNRKHWLKDYSTTYLERDLADLAKLSDLMPFKKFQQMAALRSASLISFTELSRDSGIGIETSRRYLEYLRISYQAFLLQPYHKNLTSGLVKTPKLYWFDNGLLRHLSGLGFEIDNGQLFENYIASELMKFIRTNRLDVKLTFYRTRSGMEIDFILETKNGILALEVKNRDSVWQSDFTNLKRLAGAAGKEWLGGLVIYRGNKIQQFAHGLWAIPSCRLFG
jgi:predicted AAA+ superfamily ATPase